MSERYCDFILIMPGKNRIGIAWQDRISIAQQTRISIARRCLPKAGTSASWYNILQIASDTPQNKNLYKTDNNLLKYNISQLSFDLYSTLVKTLKFPM